MPTNKLTYFDIRGRAEMTRMTFAAGGVKFEDCRVPFQDWPAMQPTTPQGVLPLLEVDGKVLYQSFAILRYAGRECNLYGSDNLEAAQIDVVLDTLLDLNNRGLKIGPWFREQDETKQAEKKAEFLGKDGVPKELEYVEKAIKNFGSNGFAASKSLSIADICLYCHLDFWRLKDVVKGCPKIVGALKKVEENVNLAKYLKERKDSPF